MRILGASRRQNSEHPVTRASCRSSAVLNSRTQAVICSPLKEVPMTRVSTARACRYWTVPVGRSKPSPRRQSAPPAPGSACTPLQITCTRRSPAPAAGIQLEVTAATLPALAYLVKSGRMCHVLGGSTAARRRCIPEEGLSCGKTVPSLRWRLSSPAARRAASAVKGIYFAGSRPLSLEPST
jgi:hypothetical protein